LRGAGRLRLRGHARRDGGRLSGSLASRENETRAANFCVGGEMDDKASELTGVWILRSAYLERTNTHERIVAYGENPRGVLILHEGGRMAAIITPLDQAGDAPPPRRKLLAYSGRYRIEAGGRFVTNVDIAWLPNWVGTPRGRTFSLRDGELHIVSDAAPVEFLDGAMATAILTWVREDAVAAPPAHG
jgi:Lipocalin-like domain